MQFSWADAGAVSDAEANKSATETKQPVLTYPYVTLGKIYSLELPGNPRKPAISPRGNYILVPAKDLDYLYYISISNKTPRLEKYTIPTGKSPVDVVIDGKGRRAYVANEDDDSITILRPDEKTTENIATIKVGSHPCALAISKNNQYLYVLNRGENTVAVVELDDEDSKVINKINVGHWPYAIKINNFANKAFVVNRGQNTVNEIDLTNPEGILQKDPVTVGLLPTDIALSKSGDVALVTNALDDSISLFSPLDFQSTEFNKLKGLSRPFAAVTDPVEEIAFVANSEGDRLNFYDLKYSSQKNITEAKHGDYYVGNKTEFIALNNKTKMITLTQPRNDTSTIFFYNVERRPVELLTPATTPQQAPVPPLKIQPLPSPPTGIGFPGSPNASPGMNPSDNIGASGNAKKSSDEDILTKIQSGYKNIPPQDLGGILNKARSNNNNNNK